MLFSPADFFNLFFSELDRLSIPYVVLHSYVELPNKIESDIDYAVLTRDLPRLAEIQRRLAESCGAVLAHTIEAHIHALYSVVIDPKHPAAFLQLDACGHYVECDRRLLTDTELVRGRRAFRSFFVPTPEVELAYLLAKALAKGTDIAPRIPILKELWRLNPAGAQAKFAQLTGNKSSLETWLELPPEEWAKLRDDMLRHNRPRISDRIRELFRAMRRIVHPKGFHIALVGGDAESRRRLRESVGPVLENAFFRRQVFYDFASEALTNTVHAPPCRGAACAWEFSKRYFKRLFPAKVRNELIFSEGGIEELTRHPNRFGVKSIGWLGGLLAAYTPKPDLSVLLVDERLMPDDTSNKCDEGCGNRNLILPSHYTEAAQVAEVVERGIQLLQSRERL
jgi:hypothetical protein